MPSISSSPEYACTVLHKDGDGNTIPCPDDPTVAHVHEWGDWAPDKLQPRNGLEYAWCPCGASKARKAEPAPAPRRPPYAVAYAVEGGALYEVALSGDATVIAEDGVLQIIHPSKAVLGITRVTPMTIEERSADDGAQ